MAELMDMGRGLLEQPEAMQGQDEGNVTPEEQAQYDEIVNTGRLIVYDKGFSNNFLKQLNDSKDKPDVWASNTVAVAKRINDQLQPQGYILFSAATEELFPMLGDFASQAGIYDPTPEETERALNLAMGKAIKLFNIDPNSPEIQQDFAAIQQADQSGALRGMEQPAQGLLGKGGMA
jgi:hypothetical protein